MARLLSHTTSLSHSTFWIDTICVPPEGSDLKATAIAQLREVYTHASIVLILDGRLAQLPVSSLLEAKMHFLCCEWFSRLWTLQEGWLASDLRVQFANTAVSVDALLRTFGLASIYPGRMGLDDELHKQLRPYFDRSAGAVNLMSLQRAMHGRRVTVPADEPICIATLLGLDLASFERPGAPTMEEILAQVKLPEGLLWGEGPRLGTPGFRWAPASLLSTYGNLRLLDYQEDPRVVHNCVRTVGGLRTEQAGFKLGEPLDLGVGDDEIMPVGSETGGQSIRLSIWDERGDMIAVFRASRSVFGPVGRSDRYIERPFVVVGSLRKVDGSEVMLAQGILVDVKQVVDRVHCARYVLGLRQMNAELVESYVHDRVVRVAGRFMGRTEWCID